MRSSSKPDERLTQDEIKSIRKVVDEFGVREAADMLRISRLSLLGALAGTDVTRGTIALIRANMR